MRTMLLSAVALAVLSPPASANQCPMLMEQIEQAILTTAVDGATKRQATALLEEGRTAHDAGDHTTSEAKLNEALALLGQ